VRATGNQSAPLRGNLRGWPRFATNALSTVLRYATCRLSLSGAERISDALFRRGNTSYFRLKLPSAMGKAACNVLWRGPK